MESKTPGHAIDHVAFLNTETGQLFSGDLYCQEKTKVILKEESIPTIIQSLQRDILKMHQEGKSPTEIKETLFPKKYPIITLSSGEWDSQHIVDSVIEDSD